METKYLITSKPLEILFNSNVNCNGSILTVCSNQTKKDFTYKIKVSIFDEKKYIFIYVEKNYMNFNYLGFYWDNKILRKGGKEVETPAAVAICFVLKQIEKQDIDHLNKCVTFYHTGKCIKCGKTLTDRISIEAGLGPHCRNS